MKHHALLLALALAGCAACPWPVTDFPPLEPGSRTPEDITLKVDGPPGHSFTASLTLDGVPRELAGVTPAAFPLHCAVLTGQVTGDGPFHLELTRHNATFFTAELPPPGGGSTRFRYHDGSLEVLSTN